MHQDRFSRNILTALLLAVLAGASPLWAAAPQVGESAPDFRVETHDGKWLTFSRLQGKRAAVLVFYATWCTECMNEIPDIEAFVKKSRSQGVLTYGVNFKQEKRIVDKLVEGRQLNYRSLLDIEGKVSDAFGVHGFPVVIGIDINGVISYRGTALPKDADAFIQQLVNPKPVPKDPLELARVQYPDVRFISKETLQEWIAKKENLVVLDVLSAESYSAMHLAGAVNIPLGELEARVAELPKDKTIVTYCYNFQCHASTRAAQLLVKLGYTEVYDYAGGLMDWKDAGFAMERAAPKTEKDATKESPKEE